MRRSASALLMLVLLLSTPAAGAEWGTIVPASSTMDSVRAVFGAPTRTETQKVEGYDTTTWVYDAEKAPTGMTRLIVEFGLLQADGFKPAVVRSFRLEPHPGVFTRDTILAGWGRPTGVGEQAGSDSFFYEDGLVVIFDKEAWSAVSMVFTQPRPSDPAKTSR